MGGGRIPGSGNSCGEDFGEWLSEPQEQLGSRFDRESKSEMGGDRTTVRKGDLTPGMMGRSWVSSVEGCDLSRVLGDPFVFREVHRLQG